MKERTEWIGEVGTEDEQSHPVSPKAGSTRVGQPDVEGRDLDVSSHVSQKRRDVGHPRLEQGQASLDQSSDSSLIEERESMCEGSSPYPEYEVLEPVDESARERRIYRARTVAMLRKYMRYSIETGRLPSILGREFFRAKVIAYTVVTFEDRVIFVHDMEKCLDKLDEFSQQLIARHILQEHDQAETGRLLQCTERTVRTWAPIALDLLSEILIDMGLLEPMSSTYKKSCQGGLGSQNFVSNCEQGKNKF